MDIDTTTRGISGLPGRNGICTQYARDTVGGPADNHLVLFELDGVHLERAGRPVLRDLTCSLPDGASALVGPSGSGKSTTLRLLNRLADPDRGTVSYRGADVRERDPRELRREVCLVPQLPALIEGSVRANVEFAAACGELEADVPELLRLSGLDDGYSERDAGRLSVGEQQRVMLARALALEPRVLLLDEPTSALDEGARDAVEATFADLRRRLDLATVVVTHDPAQARRLADWVVRVDAGRAVEQGPVSGVLTA
jgi:putative ABC transport system ATP-binding protein